MGIQGMGIYNRETLKSRIHNTRGFQEKIKIRTEGMIRNRVNASDSTGR